MAQIEIRLPKMGESVTEATITNWLKNIGEKVELDEPLVEVATDKVDNELPSEAGGILVKRFFEKDQVAQVGDVIALISTDGEAAAAITPENEITRKSETLQNITSNLEPLNKTLDTENTHHDKSGTSGKFYSPLVRSIAEKEGISKSELERLEGSGQGGRVTKKDILKKVKDEKC